MLLQDSRYSRVDELGFYDPVKSGSIDGVVGDDIPPHDRAVCRARVARYRPSEAAFPELVFRLWREDEEIAKVSLFIGRLHPTIQYDQLHSALSRLLSTVKSTHSRHHRRDRHHHHDSRDRSPWQHETQKDDSLWPLVRVVKHPITGASRGYAFAWFKSPRDARRVLEAWRASTNLFRPKNRPSSPRGVRVDLGLVFDGIPGWEQMFLEPSFSRTLPGWKPRRLGGGLGGFKESGQLRFGGIARPFRRPFRNMSP
ncbi:hypothetical protein Aperf_G00000062436 [Anoplocephala perfoliata]